jgi:hypothetical protein
MRANMVSLYRAVGEQEYHELEKTGRFRTIAGKTASCKYFGVSYDETLNFANKVYNIHVVGIVEVTVPKEQLDEIADFTRVDGNVFKNGTVIIYEEFLDKFNDSISSMYFL